jgi:hypothetical protein
MSQSLFSEAMESPRPAGFDPTATSEFNYRPVPVIAPVSLCLGLLSVSVICILRLRKTHGEYGGMWLGVCGFLLSFACFTTSGGLWAYGYTTEVPDGCRRLNFMSDISRKGFVMQKGKADFFNPDVKALDGQKVFIKGYMYPTKQMQGLTSFLLVKDNAQCCFGGNPAMQDMILINLIPGKSTDFHQGVLTSVAGVFHCQQASGPAGLQPTYTIDGMFVENSRTLF